jgi:hypothetical protein
VKAALRDKSGSWFLLSHFTTSLRLCKRVSWLNLAI